jgi:GH25 family lysozyme M1 (1,4-beta-N-acetylmuramidase)
MVKFYTNIEKSEIRMRTKQKSKVGLLIVAIVVLIAIIAAIVIVLKKEQPEPDPHEGQVYINDGFGMVWMTPLEGVEVNSIQRSEIRVVNEQPQYIGSDYETLYGVDVSEHQWDIDWSQVAASGVDFAMIRLGYRGYTEGGLFEDPYFKTNIESAAANGLKVGVYMFSQAISVEEAIAEADFVIERLADYDIDLPVVYDWEKMDDVEARTDGMDEELLTECAKAFCQRITEAGYNACVYFNRHLGYYGFDLSQLTDYTFWIALPGTFPDFYYASSIWQYSFTAAVPGIEGETDMNMMFIPVATPEPEESPAQ